MPLFTESFRSEIARAEDQHRRRLAADRAIADMTEQEARRIGKVGELFPWLPAGVAYSLGRFFDDPESPQVTQLAQRALLQALEDPAGYAQLIGDKTVNAGEVKKHRGFMDRAMGAMAAIQPHRLAPTVGKGAVRTASSVFEASIEMNEGLYRRVTSDFGTEGVWGGLQSLGRASQFYGPGAGTAMLATEEGRGLASDAGLQSSLGQMASTIGTNIGEGRNPVSGIDTGSGYFIGGDVHAQQVEKQRQYGTILYNDGTTHARTIGRDVAGLAGLDPGTKPYKVASGLVDLAKVVMLDAPVDAPIDAARHARKFEALQGGKWGAKAAAQGRRPSLLGEMADAIGMMAGGGVWMVDEKRAAAFLASPKGGHVAKKLAEITDVMEMDRLTGNKLPTDVLRELVDTTDDTAMIDVLRGHLGIDLREIPKTRKLELTKGAPASVKRLASILPGEKVDLSDERDALTQVQRWGRNYKLDDDQIRGYVDRMMREVQDEPDEWAPVIRRQVIMDMQADAAAKLRKDLMETHTWLRPRDAKDEAGIDAMIRRIFRMESAQVTDAEVHFNVGRLAEDRSIFGTIFDKDPVQEAFWQARVQAGNAARRAGVDDPWVLTKSEYATRAATQADDAARRAMDEFAATRRVGTHTTKRGAAAKIKAGGFRDDLRKGVGGSYGGAFGRGTYVATDDAGTTFYDRALRPGRFEKQGRNDAWVVDYDAPADVETLRVAADVANPLKLNFDENLVRRVDKTARLDDMELALRGAMGDEIADDFAQWAKDNRRSFDMGGSESFAARFINEYARARGFDAIDVTQAGPVHPGIGGNQLVLLDPSKATPLDPARFRSADMPSHRDVVADALERGFAVPQEVLDEYPDLVRRFLPDETAVQFPKRATPSDLVDMNRTMMPMPDPREMRRMFDEPLFRATVKMRGTEWAERGLLQFQDWWKVVTVLRQATINRIMLESQARMAHDNLSSLFRHPLDYFALVFADSRLGSKLGAAPYLMNDAVGTPIGKLASLQDDLGDMFASSERARNMWSEGKRMSGKKPPVPIYKSDPGFWEAWHDSLTHLQGSPTHQMMARARDLDEAKEVFWKQMVDTRETMARRMPNQTRTHPGEFIPEDLLTRSGADRYIEYEWDRLMTVTGGNPDIMEAFRSGKIAFGDTARKFRDSGGDVDEFGEALEYVSMSAGQGARDPRFTEVLRDRYGDVIDDLQPMLGYKVDSAEEAVKEGLSGWLFRRFYGAQDNMWNRGPTHRQYLWRRIDSLTPFLDPDEVVDGKVVKGAAADRLIENAKKAGYDDGELAQLRRMIGTAGEGSPRLGLDELNELAKVHALDDLKGLLFDLHERHQFFDALRLVFPFGEAWWEIMSRWPRFIAEDPRTLRGAGRAREFGVDPQNAETLGVDVFTPTDDGGVERRGLIFNGINNELMFAFPLTPQLLGLTRHKPVQQALNAVPLMPDIPKQGLPTTPMVGRVSGLNVGFEIQPGVGPIASVPLAQIIPDGSEFDGLRDIIFPYGEPADNVVQAGIKNMIPAWWQKILNANGSLPGGWEQYASKWYESMRFYAASGEFDVNGPGADEAEINRLNAEARRAATWLQVFQGLGQGVLPAAPSYDVQIETQGKNVSIRALANRLQTLREQHPEDYVFRFLDEHGKGAFAILQGNTISITAGGGLPPTKEAAKWLEKNPGVREDYRYAYGFFAPQGGKLDINTYQRTIQWGERERINPETLIKAGNYIVAQARYYAVRDEIEKANTANGRRSITAEQSVFLGELRDALAAEYPGYSPVGDPIPGTPAKARGPSHVLPQLEKAVNDKRFADSPVTEPLRKYLEVRTMIEGQSKQAFGRETAWATSAEGAPGRDLLFRLGTTLAEEQPAFRSVWESVLLREFDSAFTKDGGSGG